MKQILITGGPVHAHLDAVKIITNNFKGGLISDLAYHLSKMADPTDEKLLGAHITYLCSKSSEHPLKDPSVGGGTLNFLEYGNIKVIYHNGFDDYMAKVLELAPRMDAVILGAAVANLIPYKAIEGKFPSHNYKPGDLVPLIFKIAPRVIDEVKRVAPKTHLFGFKLLDGVEFGELIRAAYGVLLESHATAIIANDRRNLNSKFIVTKERAIHPVSQEDLSKWIWDMIQDEYYRTTKLPCESNPTCTGIVKPYPNELKELKDFSNTYSGRWGGFTDTPEGYVFGTLAKRCNAESFWTTGRGKHEEESYAFVSSVSHSSKTVYTVGEKATLNAPLLSHIFLTIPDVDFIAHSHIIPRKFRELGLPTLDYAPPGTVRDSIRAIIGSFIIRDHGLFLLYKKDGTLI